MFGLPNTIPNSNNDDKIDENREMDIKKEEKKITKEINPITFEKKTVSQKEEEDDDFDFV